MFLQPNIISEFAPLRNLFNGNYTTNTSTFPKFAKDILGLWKKFFLEGYLDLCIPDSIKHFIGNVS